MVPWEAVLGEKFDLDSFRLKVSEMFLKITLLQLFNVFPYFFKGFCIDFLKYTVPSLKNV